MKKHVLITAIGGDVAQGIATILRQSFPGLRITGLDIHSRHAGGLFVDQFYEAPKASDPSYESFLKTMVNRDAIDLVIPMSEPELLFLGLGNFIKIGGADLLMANKLAMDIGADKLKTAQFLQSIGIPVPWTEVAENFLAHKHLPCIFKTRRGAGSKAVFRCDTAGEVQFYRDMYSDGVVQELLLPANNEVTCGIFRSSRGGIGIVQMLRALVDGTTGWAKVIDNADVWRQCTKLAEALELRGSINVQLRITDAGPRIFEINPRFSSTVLMRHLMGFKDLIWSIQDLMGEDVEIVSPRVGMTAVRSQRVEVF